MKASVCLRHLICRSSSLLFVLLVTSATGWAQPFLQNDWSGGPADDGVVQTWMNGFNDSSDIVWLAVPGQLVLGGKSLTEPRKTVLDDGFTRPASLFPADVDGDGDIDVLGAALGDGEIAWWRNDSGRPWQRVTIDSGIPGTMTIHGRDMDGDGDVDVLAAGDDPGIVAWWENTAGDGVPWARHLIAEGFLTAHWVDTADLDGDGNVDVLGASIGLNEVAVWYMDPAAEDPWSKQVVDGDFGGARVVLPGDLDDDGDFDLVGVALVDHEISWWENSGGEPIDWQKTVINDNFRGAHGVILADLDLDGDLDIVGAGFQAVSPMWWRNDGGDPIQWTDLSLGGFFPGALNPAVGDVDGDNDLDILVTSNTFHEVGWWRNDGGDPFIWEKLLVTDNFINAWPVITADLDGNGTLEIVSGASGSTEVAFWELCDFVESGWLTSHVLDIPGGAPHVIGELDAIVPGGTLVELEIRCSSDLNDLGPWQPTRPGWSISYSIPGPAYCQYRVRLESNDSSISPVVSTVGLSIIDQPVSPDPREGQGRGGS